jgi:hypothetical protein
VIKKNSLPGFDPAVRLDCKDVEMTKAARTYKGSPLRNYSADGIKHKLKIVKTAWIRCFLSSVRIKYKNKMAVIA